MENIEQEKILADKLKSLVDVEILKTNDKINSIIETNGKVTESVKQLESNLDVLTKATEKQGEVIKTMTEYSTKAKTNPVNALYKQIQEFSQKLLSKSEKTMFKFDSEILHDFVFKTFTPASITGQIPQAEREIIVNEIPKQIFNVRAASSVSTITSNVAEWDEQESVTGTAGNQTEGSQKAEINQTLKIGTATVQTIAAWQKATKQRLADIPYLMNLIQNELIYQVLLQENAQLLTGNGTGVNLNGVTTYAQTLSLASLNQQIAAPVNYFDAIGAMITQIYENGKGKFIPNRVFVRPSDFFKMVSSKATDGQYVMPPYVMADGTRIEGVEVVQDVSIAAGRALVGDFSRFQIRDREPLSVSMGYTGNDFTSNLIVMLAEKRLASYVRSNDVQAFVYDTFANMKAYLEANS